MPNLSSRRSGALRLVTAGLLLCLAAPSVEAATGKRMVRQVRVVPAKTAPAPEAPKKAVIPIAATSSAEPSAAWTAGEPEGRACFRNRRKLWQAGEGWVVKRVSVCP